MKVKNIVNWKGYLYIISLYTFLLTHRVQSEETAKEGQKQQTLVLYIYSRYP
jgi:hypothetical protein